MALQPRGALARSSHCAPLCPRHHGRRAALGPNHKDTLASVYNLGSLLQARGELDEAEPLFREVVQGLREVLGPKHPDTLASINSLGALLQAQGKHEEADVISRDE